MSAKHASPPYGRSPSTTAPRDVRLAAVSHPYERDLLSRTATLNANAVALAKQEAELKKNTAALAKQSAQWATLADKSTKQLNEFGDVQNWAECIERDLLVVEETMRLVEGGRNEELASGTNGWR